jgi:hypothetical protein
MDAFGLTDDFRAGLPSIAKRLLVTRNPTPVQ